MSVPCQTTVSREVKEMQKGRLFAALEVRMKDKIKDIPGMISLKTDAW